MTLWIGFTNPSLMKISMAVNFFWNSSLFAMILSTVFLPQMYPPSLRYPKVFAMASIVVVTPTIAADMLSMMFLAS